MHPHHVNPGRQLAGVILRRAAFVASLTAALFGVAQAATVPSPNGPAYLRERVSTMTDNGVASINPGTRVQKVGVVDGLIKVRSAEGVEFKVKPTQITENADEGTNLSERFKDNQSAQQAAQMKAIADADAAKEAAKKAAAAAAAARAAALPAIAENAAGSSSASTPSTRLVGSALDQAPEKTSAVSKSARATPAAKPKTVAANTKK